MNIRETYAPDIPNFMLQLNALLDPSSNVLDIGSGIGVLLEHYAASSIVALEIHRPFLEGRVYSSPHIIPLHADAQEIDRLFLPRTFPYVTMIDVVEHFNKQAGLILLGKAERIASRRVVVFTPRGFFPQHIDYYGLDGDKYQKHYSGWEPEEFTALGYEVLVLKDYYDAKSPSFVDAFGMDHPPVDALLAWKEVQPTASSVT